MLIDLYIRENRELKLKGSAGKIGNDYVGTTGENNATILHLIKPETINGEPIGVFTTRLIFGNSAGSFIKNVVSDELALTADLTTEQELTISVQFLKNNVVKWESFPLRLYLKKGANDSGVNAFDSVREAQRQTDRTELGAALNACNEANGLAEVDYSETSWDGLIDALEQTRILTPENEEDLADYAATKSAAAETESKNPVDMINVWKAVEDNARIMTNRIPLLSQSMADGMTAYRLPWLPTIALTGLNFNVGYVNPNCLEYGFDCSSMSYDGLSTGKSGRLFWNYGPVEWDLVQTEKIKITNMQNITIASDLFHGWRHVTDIHMTGCSNFTEIKRMFSNCAVLANVTGDPIDLSSITTSLVNDNPFFNCNSLEEIRFIPQSLGVPLSMVYCGSLSEDSVISILNAAGANGNQQIITFKNITRISNMIGITGIAADAVAAATSRGWQIALA